jgi:hypothetical protein
MVCDGGNVAKMFVMDCDGSLLRCLSRPVIICWLCLSQSVKERSECKFLPLYTSTLLLDRVSQKDPIGPRPVSDV